MIAFVLLSGALNAQVSCDSVIKAMEQRWDNLKTLKYKTSKTERLDDEYISKNMSFTVNCRPLQVVLELEKDDDRDFVLYDSEADPEHVLYIPDGFPYKNLRLGLNSNWVRGDNHYSITNAGFEFIIWLIKSQYALLQDRITCCRETRDGVDYYCYRANAPDFSFRTYKCNEKITVSDLAIKLGVSAYLILERNKSVDSYDDDCNGLELTVPTLYGKEIEILIHAEYLLPGLIRIEDDRGLLGELNYFDFVLNPSLPDDFFTEDHLEDLE